MLHTERKARLESLLIPHQALWHVQPFKEETPDWCHDWPDMTANLLALDNDSAENLGHDNDALIRQLSAYLPDLGELHDLIALPGNAPAPDMQPHGRITPACLSSRPILTDIPGRKLAQIHAYADALGTPVAPVLEWCAGKGHLGRLLAQRWQIPVASLEIDSDLCKAGARLADRARLADLQTFIHADALLPGSRDTLRDRHVVALHACGDLHTRLVAWSAEVAARAIDVAPCCYYRTAHPVYRPFENTALHLEQDDLRLAVTETATASARQRRRSRQALAWKLGWVSMRQRLTGDLAYCPFPPVPETWLIDDFSTFIARMLEREIQRGHLDARWSPPRLPAPALLAECEATGQHRARRMLRLQLVRLAFRRALEIWLLMDMAVFLERHGYHVAAKHFCTNQLTPRNLLLSARR